MASWQTGYSYRQKITIASAKVGSTLTNFPVYVDLSDLGSSFFSAVQSDGSDIYITDDSDTECPRELVSLDTGAETGELHFNATSLSSSADTDFYIYYGKAGDSQPTTGTRVAAAWTDYIIVCHFEVNNAGTYVNSVADSDHPLSVIGSAISVSANSNTHTGMIGGGGPSRVRSGGPASVEGMYIPDSANIDFTGDFSISYLKYRNFDYYDYYFEITKATDDGDWTNGYMMGADVTHGGYYANTRGWNPATDALIPSTPSAQTDSWVYRGMRRNATTNRTYNYLNAASVEQAGVAEAVANTNDLILGTHPYFGFGSIANLDDSDIMDELRISGSARSDEWMNAEYYNLFKDSFYTVAAQETEPVGGSSKVFRPMLYW